MSGDTIRKAPHLWGSNHRHRQQVFVIASLSLYTGFEGFHPSPRPSGLSWCKSPAVKVTLCTSLSEALVTCTARSQIEKAQHPFSWCPTLFVGCWGGAFAETCPPQGDAEESTRLLWIFGQLCHALLPAVEIMLEVLFKLRLVSQAFCAFEVSYAKLVMQTCQTFRACKGGYANLLCSCKAVMAGYWGILGRSRQGAIGAP